jgi:hypothetical protein
MGFEVWLTGEKREDLKFEWDWSYDNRIIETVTEIILAHTNIVGGGMN